MENSNNKPSHKEMLEAFKKYLDAQTEQAQPLKSNRPIPKPKPKTEYNRETDPVLTAEILINHEQAVEELKMALVELSLQAEEFETTTLEIKATQAQHFGFAALKQKGKKFTENF